MHKHSLIDTPGVTLGWTTSTRKRCVDPGSNQATFTAWVKTQRANLFGGDLLSNLKYNPDKYREAF